MAVPMHPSKSGSDGAFSTMDGLSPDTPLQRREEILSRLRSDPQLPMLPAIAFQVIDKASDPECELSDLAAIISRDPVLCAKVLRTVNSVLYGLRQPMSSVAAAAWYLGIHPLRSLVLTLTISNIQWMPLPREVLQNYWRVSVAGALAARQLAIVHRRPAPDNDLVAGLVRDLGVLVLHQIFPTDYQSILTTPIEVLSGFQCELEQVSLGVHHAEVSAELLKFWRLPDEITEPVRFHHDWEGAGQLPEGQRERAQLLYFASQIGQLQLAPNRPLLVREVVTLAQERFGMNEPQLQIFLESVQEQMNEFAAVLQVDLGSTVAFASVLGRGLEELTRLAVRASSLNLASNKLSRQEGAAADDYVLSNNANSGPATAREPASIDPHLARQTCLLTQSPLLEPCPGERKPTQTQKEPQASRVGQVGQKTCVDPKTNQPQHDTPKEPGEQPFVHSSVARSLAELQARLFSDTVFPDADGQGVLGTLNGYQVSKLLGCGAMGAVFGATDPVLERKVAIKALLPHLAVNEEARRRFLQEGRAIAALTHDNIVKVYAVGEAGGIPYLVMEFVPGMSLEARLIQQAPLPLPEIIRIGLETASALSAAHTRGLVHRDIKPANLLLEVIQPSSGSTERDFNTETAAQTSKSGTDRLKERESKRKSNSAIVCPYRVKVADFGLVLMNGAMMERENGRVVGTPCFMSPEQAQGKRTGPPSDMFSLGAVLYVACTGELPFDGDSVLSVLRQVREVSPPPIRTLNPELPSWLEEIVAGLLTKDPIRRFPSSADLKRIFLCRWANLLTARRKRA